MASQPIMLRLARPLSASARRQIVRQALGQRRTFAERSDSLLSSDPAFAKSSKPPTVSPDVPLGPVATGTAATKASNPTSSATPATPATPSTPVTTPLPSSPSPGTSTLPPPTPPKVVTPPPPDTAPTVKAVPPPPPPPVPKKRFSAIRLLLYLIVATALGYGGSVFYALRSDNFHDFFTEYVPFGEEAVLYFEERAFQKRYPQPRQTSDLPPGSSSSGKKDDKKVTIPWKSGLSWKVQESGDAEGADVSQKGKHMSALDANAPSKQGVADAPQDPKLATRKEATGAIEKAKKDTPSSAARPATPEPNTSAVPKQATTAIKEEKPTARPATAAPGPPSPATTSSATPGPKSDPRPPAIAPVTQISNLSVPNAEEPVVQELVKILNDLITVVNSDSADAANKYSAPMNKAKESLASVASKIATIRDAERKAAEERVQQAHKEFDEGAKQLLKRIETAQQEDDAKYREEFESERHRLAQSYEERLRTEAERSEKLAEQRMKNELAEQAIELQRKFTADIQSLVESERGGRLSKLTDLSSNVDNLQELTSNWNGVIESNLATQKLQVAVDTVRSALARSAVGESKPKPFVREMAALKLVADGDAIVDAAIASINPSAYQHGIPSQPQLIDRFRRVAGEVRKASLLPEDAGVASHAASFVLSRVMFKKAGQPQGGDVESVLTRTETLLEEGDLDGAAREMNGLQGWAKVLSRDWLGDVRKVLEVKQALDVIETEARLQCLRVE